MDNETMRVDLTLFQTYLNLSELVHSATNQTLFEELAVDDYEFDVAQLTVAQASTYRLLLEVAGRFLEAKDTNPLVGGTFPEIVAKGLERAYYRLLAFKPLFDKIIHGTATAEDFGYYQMKQGLRIHNRQRKEDRAA